MPREPGGISVTSLYGYHTDQPLVRLVVEGSGPDTEPIAEIDMPPGKARAVALSLLEAAEGATSDAFLIHWCRDLHGTDTEAKRKEGEMMGAAFVRELRTFRELLRRQGDDQEQADQDQWERDHPDAQP